MTRRKRPPRIGIALGSGSARGWAHIGVLRALAREGIEPQIISGCSIGAFVGAVAAAGDTEKLGAWVETLGWQDVVGLMDMGLRGGLLKGDKLMAFFERQFVDRDFTALPHTFGCVATDLHSGHEVWLRDGSVSSAVRASIALPGLMAPTWQDGRLLVDGGLVNPVPVSLARAMGADVVIAVELNSDAVGWAWRNRHPVEAAAEAPGGWSRKLLSRFGINGKQAADVEEGADESLPSMLSVMQSSIAIMSVRIARSRLAGEPADVLISPRLAQLGLMDFHRGAEAIAEGEAAVELALPAIARALGR
ncbi:patatin-like phospholipase family protein [Zoogloea sp.]|uniref:patatin-like phospholipase family protein n=1 Tax=Zoogloea sp. TaxID=49181 RepID=UPI001AC2D116|nr:patatin-like phospholipase family protein [Zoogloea sp.]MBN8282135.1 patatin-like phospholipase family protein [Zoogloea sp.]